jgi:hypothetical protein
MQFKTIFYQVGTRAQWGVHLLRHRGLPYIGIARLTMSSTAARIENNFFFMIGAVRAACLDQRQPELREQSDHESGKGGRKADEKRMRSTIAGSLKLSRTCKPKKLVLWQFIKDISTLPASCRLKS